MDPIFTKVLLINPIEKASDSFPIKKDDNKKIYINRNVVESTKVPEKA